MPHGRPNLRVVQHLVPSTEESPVSESRHIDGGVQPGFGRTEIGGALRDY